jgi:hypothetical protein
MNLANDTLEARNRAEANFKKKEQQAKEGAKAMAEYEANIIATRQKIARLRALRLAKEAEERVSAGASPRQGGRHRRPGH